MAEESKSLQEKKPESEQLSQSERFTQMVVNSFGQNASGAIQITESQKRLIQGYFIVIDKTLKDAEERRRAKNNSNKDHSYDELVEVKWNNVNMRDLALDLVHYARLGLDMMQDNHLFPIPFKNNRTGKYDVNLMEGYNGIQYIAECYAIEKPKSVTIELVYDTDHFKPIKRCCNNDVESYEFEITQPFNRGKILGGFGYIEYSEPKKNKLIIMTVADIEKRKPAYASAEFWGGDKKVWKGGKQVTEKCEGWYEEMCLKTIKREVYSAKNIPRDPQKIDDTYHYLKAKEIRNAAIEAQAEIDAQAGTIVIDADDYRESDTPPALPESASVDTDTGEIKPKQPTAPTEKAAEPATAADGNGQYSLGGPDF